MSTYSLAQSVSAPRAYLNSALALMKSNSIRKNELNWTSIYEFAYKQSEKCTTIAELYPVIDSTLTMLNDQHSSFYAPEKVAGLFKGYRANEEELPMVSAKTLKNGYGYLKVPHFYFANNEEWEEFVTDAYNKLKKLDVLKPKGWIIDLRDNDGGMLVPILGAIAPFIEGSKAIGIKDADGIIKHYYYSANAVKYGDSVVYQFKTPLIKLGSKTKPVVVLINKHTGSSGEFAAAAFIGRPDTKLMGSETNGLTSSNTEFKLADGAYLVITNGTLIDRNNYEYKEVGAGIKPSIKISKKDLESDKIFDIAIKAMK
ncbi:S41 family peptidase [Pedobacter sp. 22226]